MSTFDAAFAAWLAFIASLGVDPTPMLLEPAAPTELDALERAIGYPLPDDFRALYLTTNGQLEPYFTHEEFEGTWVPLFGQYELLSLDRVLKAYEDDHERYLDWREDVAADNVSDLHMATDGLDVEDPYRYEHVPAKL